MGVPKFYRWISERYPKINQIVTDNALLPEFDHLYLDMNGIIHGCTHPPHLDASQVLTEREMMLGIMNYLDRIITQIVKPQVSVYMAIDGVAPRAKLNQQRSRRFRSALDMAKAQEDLPEADRPRTSDLFDSNCITPGTEFLAKVSKLIQYFIRYKLKHDEQWHGLTVIFSGHDVPGEGEHKIMQHLRNLKLQPHYKPNTRHCIYGQDADLIMLGLVTHEPHFTILREVINFKFDFNKDKNTLKQVKKFTKGNDFQLLHLSVVRDYLYYEFVYKQDREYDLERVIDDFVFMTFLVGNDFLPHMPTLDIGDGAFDLLFDIYKKQRSSMWEPGEYLTYKGEICDAHRLEIFLHAIGAVETEILTQREKDEAAYTKKRRKWDKRDGKPSGPSDAELQAEEDGKQSDYLSMMQSIKAKNLKQEDYITGWKPVDNPEDKDFKGRYYYEKLRITPIQKDEHWHLCKSYMEGLIWCLAYYYKGCISWGWFYPYHYGPMLSDLVELPRMFSEINLELGEPLHPFEQLMGCLPPASATLVPKPYRWLMTASDSPIIKFYPASFEVDMNGKRNPWEGVNLLPFIDIDLLKETLQKHCPPSKMTNTENERNTFGVVYYYRHDLTSIDTVKPPIQKIGLNDLVECHSSVTVDAKYESFGEPFHPVLAKGTQIPYPGFPSLNVIPIASVDMYNAGLNCFGTASKYPNTIIKLHNLPDLPDVEALAPNVLGKSVYINWPMMHEGRVVAISDATKEVRYVHKKAPKVSKHSKLASEKWEQAAEEIKQIYLVGNAVPGSGGLDIGDVKVRLRLLPLQGMKTNSANGSTKKVFGKEEADVPLQLALWQSPAPDPRFMEHGPLKLEDRFPEKCNVLLTKGKYRGCKGVVMGIPDSKNVGVMVQVVPTETPFGLAIAHTVQESYMPSHEAARKLKISPGVFGKIMGRLQFEEDRYDLGLNMKGNDGTCVIGYTRQKVDNHHHSNGKGKKESVWNAGDAVLVVGSTRANSSDEEKEERIQWEYSPRAIKIVEEYRNKFPQLFAALAKNPNERRYTARDVFGSNGKEWLPVVRDWLDKHNTAKLPRSPVSTISMSYEATSAVQKAADVRTLALKKGGYPKEAFVKVPPSALYREGSTKATNVIQVSDFNNDEAPELGDRIVNLCADGIPFGARGTVVGIHEASTTGSVEVIMDEEFLGGSNLQGACSMFRGKLCVWAHLFKVTPGDSKALASKLVPKASGQAAVNKIVSSISKNIKVEKTTDTTAINSSWDGQVDAKAESQSVFDEKPMQDKQPVSKDVAPSNTAKDQSKPRNDSSKRGKQGAWREASGPLEKDIGFKDNKKAGMNGVTKWKKFVAANNNKASQNASKASTNALKSMLGVSSSEPDSTKQDNSTSQTPAGNGHTEQLLKSMLGLNVNDNGSKTNKPVNKDNANNASDGLKAMLGVTSPAVTPQVRPAATPPTRAADKLMQMMANKQTTVPMYSAPPQVGPNRSAFNFTYVEEGQEATQPSVNSPYTGYNQPTSYPYHQPSAMPLVYGQAYGYGNAPPAHALPIPPQVMQALPGQNNAKTQNGNGANP